MKNGDSDQLNQKLEKVFDGASPIVHDGISSDALNDEVKMVISRYSRFLKDGSPGLMNKLVNGDEYNEYAKARKELFQTVMEHKISAVTAIGTGYLEGLRRAIGDRLQRLDQSIGNDMRERVMASVLTTSEKINAVVSENSEKLLAIQDQIMAMPDGKVKDSRMKIYEKTMAMIERSLDVVMQDLESSINKYINPENITRR